MMDLYTAREVLSLLKEVASTRELTSDEKHVGRVAAKIMGNDIHQSAIASHDELVALEIKRLKAQGYSEKEAREEIALEERQSLFNRGFHGPAKRCWIEFPDTTTHYSPCEFRPLDYRPAAQLLGLLN